MIRYRNFYCVFSLLLISGLLFGQVPTPSERNITLEEPVIFKDSLPKISLPDFVITGQEQISVEGSKKLDFKENRIFSLADETLTFINKDVFTRATDIPLKNLNSVEGISAFNGFVKAQAGNFTSTDLSGGLGYSYDKYFATLYGSYLSRKEHNVKWSDFSVGNIGLTFGGNISRTDNIFNDAAVKFTIGYDARNYNTYSWLGKESDDLYESHLPRYYHSFLINSSIISNQEKYYNYRVNLHFNNYKNKFDTDNNYVRHYRRAQDIEESKFALSVGGDYRYEGIDFSGDILFYNNSYSIHILEVLSPSSYVDYWWRDIDKNSFIFGLFGNASTQLSNNFFVTAGFKFYTYNYLYFLIKNQDITKGSILPQLSLRYENRNNFSLSICFNPDLKIMDFEQLYKLNPFTVYSEMNHSLNPINLFLHFDLSAIKNLRVLADLGYLEEKNTPYFYSYNYAGVTDEVIPVIDYFSYLHDATTKGVYANLKMEYNIDQFNMVYLALNYQNKKIDSLRVPFVPQIEAFINYYLLLDDNKVKVNPSIKFLSDRVSPDIGYSWNLGNGYFREYKEDVVILVNLDVEYLIIKNLIANLTVTNMLNSKYSYYRGYQEYPFSIFVGLKFKW